MDSIRSKSQQRSMRPLALQTPKEYCSSELTIDAGEARPHSCDSSNARERAKHREG